MRELGHQRQTLKLVRRRKMAFLSGPRGIQALTRIILYLDGILQASFTVPVTEMARFLLCQDQGTMPAIRSL